MNPSDEIRFGYPDEVKGFLARHRTFVAHFSALEDLCTKTFIRTVHAQRLVDRVAFYLGRLILEDFMEILLLCGNGYGDAGLKLLRGMYERLVSLTHIIKESQDDTLAERFMAFYWMNRHKELEHLRELDPEMYKLYEEGGGVAGSQSEYERVKGLFVIPGKKPRYRRDWFPKDFRKMAKDAGLGKLYSLCYFLPTLLLHSTSDSMTRRLKIVNDHLSFEEGAQHQSADQALLGSHHCLVFNLEQQNLHFRLELEEELESQRDILIKCWSPRDEAAKARLKGTLDKQ